MLILVFVFVSLSANGWFRFTLLYY